ncbi:MAG: undecaprenyldiphospho-muramoylpentapeptide beta-N-acetylglucosaminyltransferase [Xanthomonadales bacterium]|nr:undecaprenyldiphospho-muramoylpentapeptide beta-N-acetylglucosaminyltransferase [Xanthomonadales bacterium]
MGPVLIMAGGTGGHIFPGLEVAAVLRERDVPVVWLGAEGGLETRLVPAAGIQLDTVRISALRGKGPMRLLQAPFLLLRSVLQALGVLRRLRPRSVLSLGGYAAGPGGIAAFLLRRPLLVHEQNRVPGMTNRVLARLARRVLCGFDDAFPDSVQARAVGNPVRASIAAVPAPELRWKGREGPLRVLVLGGSQGARSLNTQLPAVLAGLGVELTVRHQCGARMIEEARTSYAGVGGAASQLHVEVEPFIEDMAAAYAWADLAICRAGALTLAELAAAGLGSVLVPFPHAVDDHQTRNAESLAAGGAAVLVAEGEDFGERLAATLHPLVDRDRAPLLEMAHAARALARTDAAAAVADLCLAEARA